MVSGPIAVTKSVITPLTPVMMEPTAITAPVPMMTPSTVSTLRVLCSRTVAKAMAAEERISEKVIVPTSTRGSGRAWRPYARDKRQR